MCSRVHITWRDRLGKTQCLAKNHCLSVSLPANRGVEVGVHGVRAREGGGKVGATAAHPPGATFWELLVKKGLGGTTERPGLVL